MTRRSDSCDTQSPNDDHLASVTNVYGRAHRIPMEGIRRALEELCGPDFDPAHVSPTEDRIATFVAGCRIVEDVVDIAPIDAVLLFQRRDGATKVGFQPRSVVEFRGRYGVHPQALIAIDEEIRDAGLTAAEALPALFMDDDDGDVMPLFLNRRIRQTSWSHSSEPRGCA